MPNERQNPIDPALLTPGDARSLELDLSQFTFTVVKSIKEPMFELGYARLWDEFGRKNEIETIDVIERRMKWDPSKPADGLSLLYEMLVVTQDECFVAARDQTAIVDRNVAPHGAVVHLSHVLVDPAHRRSGIAGWLRAWPITTARRCLAAVGASDASPITLVGEMEYASDPQSEGGIRLRAYEKAGFLKVDPSVVQYFQPDFRPPEEIDGSGGTKPLPMTLVVRRVGRESERTITGAELRHLIRSLYAMYAKEFRPQDIAELFKQLQSYPPEDTAIALIPPTRL